MATPSDPQDVEQVSKKAKRRRGGARPTPTEVANEAAAIYPDTFDTPPTPEEIAAEAHKIYVERGGTDGQDLNDWYEAERRLRERRSS